MTVRGHHSRAVSRRPGSHFPTPSGPWPTPPRAGAVGRGRRCAMPLTPSRRASRRTGPRSSCSSPRRSGDNEARHRGLQDHRRASPRSARRPPPPRPVTRRPAVDANRSRRTWRPWRRRCGSGSRSVWSPPGSPAPATTTHRRDRRPRRRASGAAPSTVDDADFDKQAATAEAMIVNAGNDQKPDRHRLRPRPPALPTPINAEQTQRRVKVIAGLFTSAADTAPPVSTATPRCCVRPPPTWLRAAQWSPDWFLKVPGDLRCQGGPGLNYQRRGHHLGAPPPPRLP